MTTAQVETLSSRTLLLLRTLAPTTGLSPEEVCRTGADGFACYLRATLAYIRASVPLMEEACLRFAQLGEQKVVAYLQNHIEEERDHDLWTIEDLQACGLSADLLDVELIPEIAAACGAQYYHIRHGNPWLFFAYVFALETEPPSRRFLDVLRTETGLPDPAFRTVALHQELDGGHSADLADLIDTFQLTEPESRAFLANAVATATQLHVAVRKALNE